MKTYTLLLSFIIISLHTIAQSHYQIIYDKSADEFTYVNVTVNTKSNKAAQDTVRRLPNLQEGDIITVLVKNYNPFVHHVKITSHGLFEESADEYSQNSGFMSVLNMVSGGLGPISTTLGSLSSTAVGRSSDQEFQSLLEENVKNRSDYDDFTEYNRDVNELIKNYRESYKDYHQTKSRIYQDNLYLAKDSIIDSLRIIDSIYTPSINKIYDLYTLARKSALKAGLKGPIREDFRLLEIEMNNFKTFVEDPRNDFNPNGFSALIQALEAAKFEIEKTFEVSAEDAAKSSKGNGDKLAGMMYEINFYDIENITRPLESMEGERNINHVSYYYTDRYYDTTGIIVDVSCQSCIPVLRAEGLYEGEAPRYYEDLFKNSDEEGSLYESGSSETSSKKLSKNALGRWFFYDKDGELSRIDEEPSPRSTSSLTSNPSEKSGFQEVLEEKRTVTLPLRSAVVMKWSTGFYGINSFQGRNEYEAVYNETDDTMTISANSLPNLKMCLGSQIVFDFRGNKIFAPSFNLGAAIDLRGERDVHFLAGTGIKFKFFPLLSLTGGLAFTPYNKLDEKYQVGGNYAESNVNEVSSKYYGLGYYFGANINF